jgi:anthranilate synthase/aminodeoxychorismate synthase-like glutamine amidotransferase
MILVVDNYDSFTFNLVQYFLELGAEVTIKRNDVIDVAGIRAMAPTQLVLSPGPGAPNDAGVCLEAVQAFSGTLPILGVCLGHQAIGQCFGGNVVRAQRVMHGKTSKLRHDTSGLFHGVPDEAEVGRYHSLVVDPKALPDPLIVTATAADDGEIMGFRHRQHPTVGVQFHPESVLTPHGKQMLRNFLEGRLA